VHRLKKCSQCDLCDSRAPASKRLCAPLNRSSVPKPVVNSDHLCLHVVSLFLSGALAVDNATPWVFSAFSLLCAPVARWDAYGRAYRRVMSATTLSCGTIVALDCSDS